MAVIRRSEPRRGLLVAAAAILALLVAACGGGAKRVAVLDCPNVLLLSKAGSLKRFAPGPGRDVTDVVFDAGIVNFRGSCEFDEDDSEVDVELLVTFGIKRGPANRAQRVKFSYFVAIPRFYPAPQGKKKFTVEIPLDRKLSRIIYREKINLTIPLKKGERGTSYDVYVGFQLTPDEAKKKTRRRRR